MSTTLCLSWWLFAVGRLIVCLCQPAFASHYLLPVSPCRSFKLFSACCLCLSDKAYELLPFHTTDAALLSHRRSMPCARTSNTWLFLHVYLPSANTFVQAYNTYSSVAFFAAQFTQWVLFLFQRTDIRWSRQYAVYETYGKANFLNSIFLSSSFGNFLVRTDPHLSRLPCFFLASALVLHDSSLHCLNLTRTSSLWRCFELSPPCVTVPMMSRCLCFIFADLTFYSPFSPG